MAGYKALAVPMQGFLELYRGESPGFKVVGNPLPKDAKVTEMRVNMKTGDLEFCIYSETYDWIKPGLPIPFVPAPIYKELR